MGKHEYEIYSTTKEAWDAMYQAISAAEKSVYWELYIFEDDEVGQKFYLLLQEKVKQGVDVKIIIDYLGSFGVSRKRVQELRVAGIDILLFNEVRSKLRGWWRRLWTRTHRKILIIDEKIGFLGGVNIQKEMADWSDINIRIEGKVVRSMLRAFARSYRIAGGPKKNVRRLLKYSTRLKHVFEDIELVYDEAHPTRSKAKKMYIEALTRARERVILFSPYYFPDKKFLEALWDARKRGVRVDLLIPFRSDVRLATFAAYAWFSVMKRHGIHIHLHKKMMHGKGVIVDDEWAMVGSSNIDQGSFYDNYEANVKIKDKLTVHNLKRTVQGWLDASIDFDELRWTKRGWVHRCKEWCALKLYWIWHRAKDNGDSKKEP